MSDGRDLRIEPAAGVGPAAPVERVRSAVHGQPEQQQKVAAANTTAATTGGGLRAAYAQVAVNPDTHDVIIRIRDSATDQVLSETPSPEVEAMTKYLNTYASTMGRHRAQFTSPASA